MEKLNLNIEVESEVANLYKIMDSNQQKKIDLLLAMWLKAFVTT